MIPDPLENFFPLQYRFAVGITVFAILGYLDWKKNGWEGKRVREYGYLAIVGTIGALYGAIHDLITVSISEEYFVVAKGLDDSNLFLNASWLGAKAAFGPALLVGVAFLFLNNPSQKLEQHPFKYLIRKSLIPLLTAALGAALCGVLAWFHLFPFKLELPAEIESPRHFLTTWSIHIGSYAGGLLGLLVAGYQVRVSRRIKSNS